jgi:hypothetical protein
MEILFDGIYEAHTKAGHAASSRTHKTALEKYCNIAGSICAAHFSLCLICVRNKINLALKTTLVPIVSKTFNDRGQLDLIDMQSASDGPFNWILLRGSKKMDDDPQYQSMECRHTCCCLSKKQPLAETIKTTPCNLAYGQNPRADLISPPVPFETLRNLNTETELMNLLGHKSQEDLDQADVDDLRELEDLEGYDSAEDLFNETPGLAANVRILPPQPEINDRNDEVAVEFNGI